MKNLLTLFFAVLVAVASVRAEEAPSITPLTNGDNNVYIDTPTSGSEWRADPSIISHYTLFSYTALGNGHVTIYADGDKDTYGALFNGDMEYIESADDGYQNNFKLEFDVKAGDVYYIGARGYYDDWIGSYIIHVEGPLASCGVGLHTMGEYVAGTPATCLTEGVKSHYECTTCHHTFSDAEGEEEIDDVTIPALGHNMVDGECTREGCGYVDGALPLTNGYNNVVIDNPTSRDEWKENIESYQHYTLFKYTAPGNGHVTIYSVGDKDTYGALYNGDMEFIGDSDDSYQYNFEFQFDVKKGDVYYIGARGLNDDEIGSYIIYVDGPLASCGVGLHTMGEHVAGTPATCLTDGVKSHYECTTCHHTFSDAEGEEEIDEIIPALGHNMVDGECTREGCGYVDGIKPLTHGNNIVCIYNPTSKNDWTDDRGSNQHYVLFSYTAQADGHVMIYANGYEDTFGVLFDGDMEYIKCSDDDYGRNFLFEFDVKAGDVYYIGARGYGDYDIGGYIIKVKDIHDAAIGDIKYKSFTDALIDAQGGETVTLLDDIEYPDALGYEFAINGTVTIDLNGHTMYGYIYNYGHLTIEDSSEGKTGKMITLDDYCLLCNNVSGCSITINGGTFVGGQITSATGAFYINGGTFILPEGRDDSYTMSEYDNVVFGENVVYRDLSGEHDDITEITEDVTYSGTFVNVSTATGIDPVNAEMAGKAVKTIENGRVVIIRGGEKKYDLTGREL